MKNKNIIFADALGIILALLGIISPLTNINFDFFRIYNIYFLAYFAYLFISMEGKKPFFILAPLLFYSFIIMYVFKGMSLLNNRAIFLDYLKIIFTNFRILSLALIFYLIERMVTIFFGKYVTSGLGIISFIIYLVAIFTGYLKGLDINRDYFLYFFVFIIFSNLLPSISIKKYLYVIVVLCFGLEVLLTEKYKINLGFYVSGLFLIYLILKADQKIEKIGFEKYFLFSLLLIYPMIRYIFDYFLEMGLVKLSLASLIVTFFLAVIFFELKIKFFDYLFLGVHAKKRKKTGRK